MLYGTLRRLLAGNPRYPRRPLRRTLVLERLENRTVPSAAPNLGLPFPAGNSPNIYLVTTTGTPTDQSTQFLVQHELQFTFSAAYGGYVASNKDGTPMSLYEAGWSANAAARPNSSGNVIFFDLAGKGPFVFNLPQQNGYAGVYLSAGNVTINGYSQGNLPNHKATARALVNSSTTADDAHILIQINDRIGLEGTNDRILGVSVPGLDIGGPAGNGGNDFIAGDYIGVKPDGTAMNAALDGIAIGQRQSGGHGSNGNTIGTALPADRNVIGNHTDPTLVAGFAVGNGIGIYNGSSGNSIQNDLIGKNLYGIHFDATHTTGNAIRGNIIVFNTGAGIRADGGSGNTFAGNTIASNGMASTPPPGAGIVLAPGANNNIAAPLFVSWNPTSLSGILVNATPGLPYRLDFYNNTSTDAAGRYEGALPWASVSVTPDSHGNFTATVPEPMVGGLTATVTDPNGNTSALSLPTDFNIVGSSAPTLNFNEGAARNNVLVGTLVDGNPYTKITRLQATINWGDGTTSVVTSQPSPGGKIIPGPGGTYQIRGNHSYAEDGSYHIRVTVLDLDTRSHNDTINTLAVVAETDLSASPVSVTATEGLPFSGSVGTFVDPGSPDAGAQFTAQIDWGDGQKSSGTVVADGAGHYHVLGSHTYTEESPHHITATLTESGVSVTPALHIVSAVTVADAALHLTPASIHHVEGTAFTDTIATFTDDNPGHDITDYTATIDWGDGTKVLITSHASPAGQIVPDAVNKSQFDIMVTHTFREQGANLSIHVQVNDVGGASVSGVATAQIDDAALTPAPVTITPTEGQSFSGVVAQFTDADPSGTATDYTATINWGDGTTTTASSAAHTLVPATVNGQPGFAVLGTHTFADEGSVEVDVSVTDETNPTPTIVKSTANVADAPLTVKGQDFTAVEGTSVSPIVATFTDANPTATAADFTATIAWGTGTTSNAVVTATANGFTVQPIQGYAYPEEGAYTLTVTINDDGTVTAYTVSPKATVTDAVPVPVANPSITAIAGTAFNGAVLSFTDPGATPTPGEFTASIDWGDGTTTQASAATSTITVTPGNPPTFNILGTHTYATNGTFQVKVVITDQDGATVTITGSATVSVAVQPV